jgi:quinol monooxygenase YgiN
MTTFIAPDHIRIACGQALGAHRIGRKGGRSMEEALMILGTARVDDFDRFWQAFSTKGAELRKQHGSKGAQVFRDPDDANRVFAVFDWDEEGWQSYLSNPQAAEVFKEGGIEGRPEIIPPVGETDA